MSRPRGSWIPKGHGGFKSYDVWFMFTIALGCLLAGGVGAHAITHGSQEIQPFVGNNSTSSRIIVAHPRQDKCKLVRHAHDQCAFIKAHCEDTEAGLLSYLSLYYCRLADAKPLAFTILVFWLGLLFMTIGIAASEFFCINLNTIAMVLGMSENVAGVTLLALGNGSPDVFSTFAAMSSHSGSLALGELIGAACFITTVVAGSMALVQPFQVARSSFVRDVSFFILAGAFSMVFLADGRLQLWECIVMICLYVSYVCLVMFWHWKFERGKENVGRDERTRQQSMTLEGGPDVRTPPQVWPAYHDYFGTDEEHSPRSNGLHGPSSPGRPGPNPLIRLVDEEEAENHQEVSLATLTSNMRVNRGVGEKRRPTLSLIRPSLMGALEFRAAMHTVKKRHSYQGLPQRMRRHSYDPSFARRGPQHQLTSASDPLLASHLGTALAQRAQRSQSFSWSRRNTVSRRFSNPPKADSSVRAPTLDAPPEPIERGRPMVSGASSPSISVSPSPSAGTLENHVPEHTGHSAPAPNLLAPPAPGFVHSANRKRVHPSDASETKPELQKLGMPHTDASIDSRVASPFPAFTDSPTPMSVVGSPYLMAQDGPLPLLPSLEGVHVEERPSPSGRFAKILSSISAVLSRLFPGLCNWRDKDLWEKFLAIVAAPSVFLLTITLPVVDSVEGDGDETATEDATTVGEPVPKNPAHDDTTKASLSGQLPLPNGNSDLSQHPITPNIHPDQSPTQPLLSHRIPHYGALGYPNDILEERIPHPPGVTNEQAQDHLSQLANEPVTIKVWNRWLVCVQIIVAPLFVTLIVWANNTSDPTNFRTLGYSALYTLLGSIIVLLFFLALTDAHQPPQRRYLLCFLGFIVSIAWISTIAAEVVGVLKAFGVILGISDAILGLTIFAVGNSLGDLVADITVARLGYQVMALSACFGGPLLNILLGIGIGGLYRTVHNSSRRHRRHPHDDIEYKPYELQVSTTLVISGATLLVTLVGLLICVPLNGWRMDRKIGWGLVALWSASTIGNVIVEVIGWGGSVS
ncbi:MAG: hypothetical protein M1823_001175 [Watsoniomyces obsoletus]|nr:MAG: hypothetical protein M1823_001175 [Watsoniomyces obsoletus]